MPDLTALAAEVDGLLDERVLVFGSLPSAANDLDLLVRNAGGPAVAAALRSAGFAGDADTWQRVTGDVAEAVETVDVGTWALPQDQVDALFAEAVPLQGLRHLSEPAPHHRLLILARRLVPQGGRPDGSRLERLRRALAADPAAASRARDAAAAWACAAELEVLLDVHRTGRAIRRREALAARLAAEVRTGRSIPRAATALVTRRLKRIVLDVRERLRA